ncbi:MAG: glycogen synthase GlgA [Thermodesulfobacteriota bacterium]|nr:glycogen synthase GlgA [Thermodesulfobacteriota bacterium]
MKVLFCSSEIAPYAKTGGLADVSAALPEALRKIGVQCSTVMPLYREIQEMGLDLEYVTEISFVSGSGIAYSRIFRHAHTYFIENNDLFGREGIYAYKDVDFPDNLERFAYFSRACVEMLSIMDDIDVIHINDWQTALVPAYLKALGITIPTLFSIHNLVYQGIFDSDQWPILLLPEEFFAPDGIEYYGKINVMKSGIVFSDMLSTVSPSYAHEIQSGEFGAGLDGLLRSKRDRLTGITNGIDYKIWDPSSDSLIAQTYSADDQRGKQACKKDLLRRLDMDEDTDRPVFGMIGRMTGQKGFDLLADILPKMIHMGSKIAILGSGDPELEKRFRVIQQRYKKDSGICIGFNEPLAHAIEAGSDFFLMPSRFEPCGLNQMISMHYGTLPIATAVGGLRDTITAIGEGKDPCGIRISEPGHDALLKAVKTAHALYTSQQSLMKEMILSSMRKDFRWEIPAKKYLKLYKNKES